ncbi:putative cob(I)alamin adenosyltransferase [Candidatus Hodgkinia cicadicola]|nr:putative cob(I)alamin adenosyltransferase [Candidatus Hodgkinia cicadicola]
MCVCLRWVEVCKRTLVWDLLRTRILEAFLVCRLVCWSLFGTLELIWVCCVCGFRRAGSGCERGVLVFCCCVVSELAGDSFWLCVVRWASIGLLDANLVYTLFSLRSGNLDVLRCAVLCKRNYFNGGIGAQVRMEC